jgi:Rod binding domain-containing protein
MSDFLSQSVQQAGFTRLQGQTDAALQKAKQMGQGNASSASGQPKTDKEIEDVAKGFDAIFIRCLIQEMRKSVEKTDLMGEDSSAMRMYEDMFDENLAEAMAEQGLGIGDMVRNYLKEYRATVHEPGSEAVRKHVAEGMAQSAQFRRQSAGKSENPRD